MGKRTPIGKRESQQLEFKSADALRNLFSISREVVAMLNARGGEIWIGLREDNGIAVEVEGISDAERAKVNLLNHLIEVIEPRLQDQEVLLTIHDHESRAAIVLEVSPDPSRKPYAQLRDGGRFFLQRVDHRIRPMTREEIFPGDSAKNGGAGPGRLLELRERRLQLAKPGLWIGIEPIPPLQLDVQSKDLETLLVDPKRSGNRPDGWSFRYPPFGRFRPRVKGPSLVYGDEDFHKTTVWEDGCIEFWSAIDGLHHGTDKRKEIYPLALLEFAISMTRLGACMYRELAVQSRTVVFVDVALTRITGWYLPAYAPRTYGYMMEHEPNPELEDGHFVLPSPLRFSWRDYDSHPDESGYLLVRAIYQAFGLREDRIPKEYDRLERRLVLEG